MYISKMNKTGYTLVELLIGVAFVGILFAVGMTGFATLSGNQQPTRASTGYNGVVETRCMNGYSFVVGHDGSARQIMDEFGHGVRCP